MKTYSFFLGIVFSLVVLMGVGMGQTALPLGDIFVFDENTAIAVGDSGTVIKTIDGGESWDLQYPVGAIESELSHVQFIDDLNGWASYENIIIETIDAGNTWAKKSELEYGIDFLMIRNSNEWWAGSQNWPLGFVSTTKNGGLSWTTHISSSREIYKFMYFKDDYTGWIIGDPMAHASPAKLQVTEDVDSTYLKTIDGGETWFSISDSLEQFNINSMFFFNADTGWAVGGFYGPLGKIWCSIIKTIDGGENWSEQPFGSEFEHFPFYYVFFANDSIGWVWQGQGWGDLFKTENGGETWIEQKIIDGSGLKAICFINAQVGWAVGNNGLIMKTMDGGENWINQSGNVTKIEDDTNHSIKIPLEFELSQNFPNPFNPITSIEFTLPKSEFVTLKVYNILGEEISTLVNDKLQAGNHTYQFDGSNLASGVYMYRIEAGEYQQVRKMVLLK